MAIVRVTRGISEWVQRNFDNVGQDVQRKDGDYAESTGLVWDTRLRRLIPLPAFESVTTSPDYTLISGGWYADSGGDEPVISFFCRRNSDNRICAVDYLIPDFFLFDVKLWAAGTLYTNVGNRISSRGLRWYTMNGDIYNSSDTTTVFSAPVNDRYLMMAVYGNDLYAIDNEYSIYRLNDDGSAFNLYLEGNISIGSPSYIVLGFSAHRQALSLVLRDNSGRVLIVRVPDTYAQKWHEVLSFKVGYSGTTGFDVSGVEFSGEDILVAHRSERATSITRASTSDIDVLARFTHGLDSSVDFALWEGYRLLLVDDVLHIQSGGGFAVWKDFGAAVSGINYGAGMVFLRTGSTSFAHSSLTDFVSGGEVITSRLTMGSPGTDKHLHSITVLLDAEVEDVGHKTAVYYRVNANEAWTELTASGGDAGLFLRFDDIKVGFYLMQVRVVLNNSVTGRTGISEISATYSTP